MQKNVMLGLIASMLLVLGTTSANALILSADINYGSTTATLTPVNANYAIGTLSAGDIIGLQIRVDNAPGDVISAIFTTLTWDTTQVTFLGGGFTGGILTGTCTGFSCTPPVLASGIGSSPIFKPLSPFGQATGITDWLQIIAHTNPSGTNGTGPDVVANVGFQVLPGGAGQLVTFGMIIEPNSDTVAGAGGGTFLGTTSLLDATINPLPEPGTALLIGLGLMGLGATGRRES